VSQALSDGDFRGLLRLALAIVVVIRFPASFLPLIVLPPCPISTIPKFKKGTPFLSLSSRVVTFFLGVSVPSPIVSTTGHPVSGKANSPDFFLAL